MRISLAIPLILLASSPAFAQSQPAATPGYPVQGTVYAGQPVYTPYATDPYAPPPAAAPASPPAPPAYVPPKPGEYGHSIMNDIRQMNF